MSAIATSRDPVEAAVQLGQPVGEDGGGNIDADPLFVDPQNHNYHLQYLSPCIDAGDPYSDYSREPQPNGGRINLGVYGGTPEATTTPEKGDVDGDGDVDLADAVVITLQVVSGREPIMTAHRTADVNGDGKIALEEAIFILQRKDLRFETVKTESPLLHNT